MTIFVIDVIKIKPMRLYSSRGSIDFIIFSVKRHLSQGELLVMLYKSIESTKLLSKFCPTYESPIKRLSADIVWKNKQTK